jgi:hypothetical protein
LGRANKVVDNMIFLANQASLPQLAQQWARCGINWRRTLRKATPTCPQPSSSTTLHRASMPGAFMKKYKKQRFGSPTTLVPRRLPNLDWFSWRAPRMRLQLHHAQDL